MEFENIIKYCILILEKGCLEKTEFTERYKKIIDLLERMELAINEGRYPNDYDVIPLLNYIDRNVYDEIIYHSLIDLNKWYISNYRKKDQAIILRERIERYLTDECRLSENRMKMTIKKFARQRDIYFEFAEFVEKKEFTVNGIEIHGFNAKTLNMNYPLSALGAYDYLIYLREQPEEALADLKKGLPRK